jgi:hypothetical protein
VRKGVVNSSVEGETVTYWKFGKGKNARVALEDKKKCAIQNIKGREFY